ncbi:sensor domain-containing protein [Kitasatospora sp. NPDC059571]|uniref:sensor domain-containing protein n=1 Tax=Kitasatospora sp. NPDC059571 TaxID=3346871 RepID=UPI0036D089F8
MSTGTLHRTAHDAWPAGPGTGARRPGFLRAPFSAATYREIGYVLTGLPLGIAGFCLAVTGVVLGAGLVVTAVGLPVLALLLTAARGFGALERHRARTLLGAEVAAPAPVRPARRGVWGAVTARLADGAGWRAVLYQVLMFPWAVLGFAVTLTFLITGWVLALYPLYHWVFARYTDWPGYRVYDFTTDAGRHYAYYITSPAQIAGVSAVGLLLVLVTPWLVRGLTGVSRVAVRGLLGAR